MRQVTWRRYLPPKRISGTVHQPTEGLFGLMREKLTHINAHDFDGLDREITHLKANINESDAASLLLLLLLQSPRAAHAQALMDEYPHGYHDRDKRLYELIDFNDSFVSTVLALESSELKSFNTLLKLEIDAFCKKMYSRTFDDEQYEAITHGLSREIAVYRALCHAGFYVVMTPRSADAFGIDMQVLSPQTEKYINIDCKTSSAFHFRLKDLVHQGRLAPHDQTDAETKGWWEITNKGHDIKIRIVLLRVSQDDLGPIEDFTFKDDSELLSRVEQIVAQRGLSDGRFSSNFVELM